MGVETTERFCAYYLRFRQIFVREKGKNLLEGFVGR